jgi:hypothetical protein
MLGSQYHHQGGLGGGGTIVVNSYYDPSYNRFLHFKWRNQRSRNYRRKPVKLQQYKESKHVGDGIGYGHFYGFGDIETGVRIGGSHEYFVPIGRLLRA